MSSVSDAMIRITFRITASYSAIHAAKHMTCFTSGRKAKFSILSREARATILTAMLRNTRLIDNLERGIL
jgi:hypothetical protein